MSYPTKEFLDKFFELFREYQEKFHYLNWKEFLKVIQIDWIDKIKCNEPNFFANGI
tara:strand:- start:228 stop:395 length:168 start_codon:yes stop_codon:yes gene_type:complete